MEESCNSYNYLGSQREPCNPCIPVGESSQDLNSVEDISGSINATAKVIEDFLVSNAKPEKQSRHQKFGTSCKARFF